MAKKAVTTEETTSSDTIQNINGGTAKWYIVSTYTGHEKKVAQLIQQRIKANGLEDEIMEVLVPIQEKVVAKEGKKRTIEEKIFPGYVIIRMVVNDQTWHLVRNTDGVTGFIGPSKQPTPLSDDEVKAILAFSEVKQPSFQATFRVGSPVKVVDGPFKDFIGEIKEINQDKGQVRVMLSFFGRDVLKEFDFLEVSNL